jgi:hypothetical protein
MDNIQQDDQQTSKTHQLEGLYQTQDISMIAGINDLSFHTHNESDHSNTDHPDTAKIPDQPNTIVDKSTHSNTSQYISNDLTQ